MFTAREKVQEIFKTSDYQVFHDKVQQASYTAKALSRQHIVSDYNSFKEPKQREWQLKSNIDAYPSYHSDQILVDALYNMSLDETEMLTETDGTFRTGAEWAGVWTRDISYSVILAYAYLAPEICKTSLLKKVKNDQIIQDIGSGGAWPVSTDRVVWAVAAWELYKVTGDLEWLQKIYPIIDNSLQTDLITIVDEASGIIKGESSFLDWRDQTYPAWMDNAAISQSLTLGTNVVFYQAFRAISKMANLLNVKNETKKYHELAENLKTAINKKLWNGERSFFNQYLYGEHFMNESPRAEALGEALAILYEVSDEEKQQLIVENLPVVNFGIPSIFPQIPNVPPYHNNGIWPFVQAFWNWAAAKTKNQEALTRGLSALYRSAALFLTNKENLMAQDGDHTGTVVNSDRQLWSVAGNLSMIYRVFLGMNFQIDGLAFDPFVPKECTGSKAIKKFKYRDAVLNINIEGYGDHVELFALDGKAAKQAFIPSDLIGEHDVRIVLNHNFQNNSKFHLRDNHFSLPAPDIAISKGVIEWPAIENAVHYYIYHNGKRVHQSNENTYLIDDANYGQFKVTAVDAEGWESFSSKPQYFLPESHVQKVDLKQFAVKNKWHLKKVNDEDYINITTDQNINLKFPLSVNEPGEYLLAFRYANGSGPWNTDNKCAIRSLLIDDHVAGTLVMPQRGMDDWTNWGVTNYISVHLARDVKHTIAVVLKENNINMDVRVNQALLESLLL